MDIQVVVNGKPHTANNEHSLKSFLDSYSMGEWVAVALNSNIISREKYSEIHLKDGDRLDILHPVAGG